MLPFALVLASLSPFLAPAIVMSQRNAIIASIVLVLIVILAWKFLKLAFKIALVVAVAIGIFLVLRWAGIL
ncbi:MAG TPA: hypothetical protein VM370_00430 [Candidatus Thermoplasmatota archaeon]|nr:hypothetical protein [Candidatus Thermoplasmatota archaeon]